MYAMDSNLIYREMELEISPYNRSRLLVAADDFGISERANRNILYLLDLGKIDRISVMVNGVFTDEELDRLLRSSVKLDIHLDVLHELENPRQEYRGILNRTLGFGLKLLTRKITKKKIDLDWNAQIIRFKEIFGKYPDGLNSHEHLHFFPPFFKVILGLQEKYSIPYLRFGDSLDLRHHHLVGRILHWLHLFNQWACGKNSCVSSNSLVSLDWIDDLDAFLENLPAGTTEIACHPEKAEEFVKVKKYF